LRVAGLKTLTVGCIGDYCWVSVRRVTKRGRRGEGVTLTQGHDPGRIDVVTLGVEEALEESLKVPADGPPDRVNGDPLTNGLSLEISQVDVLEAANFQSEHSRNKERKRKRKRKKKSKKDAPRTRHHQSPWPSHPHDDGASWQLSPHPPRNLPFNTQLN